jgi:hypothetical protein
MSAMPSLGLPTVSHVAMSDAAVAIAAGAIGSALTVIATAGVRFSAARREIELDDLAVSALDEDLERWVVDEDVSLRREIMGILNDLGARGALQSGDRAYLTARAREAALHRYRDRETESLREALRVQLREGASHSFWRRFRRRPFPKLDTPTRAEPVLEAWRGSIGRHEGRMKQAPHALSDPRERSLAKTIENLDETYYE